MWRFWQYFCSLVVPATLALASFPVLCGTALARDPLSLIPSSRWITLSSPVFPRAQEECNALAQEFSEITRRLDEQHQECLDGAPSDEGGSGGACSKASCQFLHSTREKASRKASEESRTCSKRVNDYLVKEREDARRRQQAAEASDRAERTRAKEDAEARSKRDRVRDARDAKDRLEKEDRDRRDREARDEREGQDRESAERQREERERRDAESAAKSARAEAALARIRAQEADDKRARDAQDQNLYVSLIEKVRDGKDAATHAKELLQNPFEKMVDFATNELSNGLVNKGLDIAAPLGAEVESGSYDLIANAADRTRSSALGGNPFAEKLSGLAMEGVNKVNRQTLGQLDVVQKQMAVLDNSQPSTTTVARPTRSPAVPVSRSADKPFISSTRNPPAPVTVLEARDHPISRDSTRYEDPSTGRTYDIPAGRTLYRHPDSGNLTVIDESRLATSSDDDRIVDGMPVCSAHGKGRVLPECERWRGIRSRQ